MANIINVVVESFKKQYPDWFENYDSLDTHATKIIQLVRLKTSFIVLIEDLAHCEYVVGRLDDDPHFTDLHYFKVKNTNQQIIEMHEKFYHELNLQLGNKK